MKRAIKKMLSPRVKNVYVEDVMDVPGVGEIIEEVVVKVPEKPTETLEAKVFEFLKNEFVIHEAPGKLKTAAGINAPPLCMLRSEGEVYSVWYRLPIKGESGVGHIPDFTLFIGNHRMSPREKNPDIVIECRKLLPETSNRTDPRVVKDVLGLSLDTIPGTTILVTNRALSNYARALADDYNIGLLELEELADPSNVLYKLIVDPDQPTRARLLDVLNKRMGKLEHTYRLKKRAPSLSGKQESISAKGSIRERIIKVLSTHPGFTAKEIAITLSMHDDYVLNELYALHKEGRAKISKQAGGAQNYKYNEWSLTKRNE